MNKNLPLVVAGIIFGLVAIAHLVRVILNGQIIAFGHTIPMSVSYIGFVITLILSIWMFLAAKR